MDDTTRYSYQAAALRATLALAAVGLSFAALHDITSGRETDLTNEYMMLLASAGWLAMLSIGLLRAARPLAGGLSLAALGAAAVALRRIGSGASGDSWPHYVMAAAIAWFFVLALVLFADAWRIARGDRVHS